MKKKNFKLKRSVLDFGQKKKKNSTYIYKIDFSVCS